MLVDWSMLTPLRHFRYITNVAFAKGVKWCNGVMLHCIFAYFSLWRHFMQVSSAEACSLGHPSCFYVLPMTDFVPLRCPSLLSLWDSLERCWFWTVRRWRKELFCATLTINKGFFSNSWWITYTCNLSKFKRGYMRYNFTTRYHRFVLPVAPQRLSV